MSKIAEEAAFKAYPVKMTPLVYQDLIDQFGGKTEIDVNTYPRCLFLQGYEQAEKDLADVAQFSSGPDGFFYGKGYQQGKKDAEKDLTLTWEDISIICQAFVDVNYEFDYHSLQEKYEEILRRFKEEKE